ncbi:MAG: Gx transporter family protein [Clostridia bacterium]|nr:Gx transporter family protein [Clostridia bacterium]MBR2472869.1 Gx transporter family protein [Clostridia bacterium]MBR6742301.1 Gx transporter family protein [Clostridia bacterium]
MKASKLTLLALSVSLAMILSFIESQIPTFVPIPGVKVGLANIAVVFALYKMDWKNAAIVSLVRVLLIGILFGNAVSLAYSAAGAVLSLIFMIVLKKTDLFSHIAVSVVGGVVHNLGQIGMACILMGTDILRYYAPFLVLSGTIAGIVIGIIAAILVKRINIKA